MTQINQYTVQIDSITNPIKDPDFIDVDKLTSDPPPTGPYQSQKMTWKTLKEMIAAEVAGQNLATTDLIQTPSVSTRNYNAAGGRVLWSDLAAMDVTLSSAVLATGFTVSQPTSRPEINGNMLQNWAFDGRAVGNIYEDGSTAFRKGSHYTGDGTGLLLGTSSQPDTRFLNTFASAEKSNVFTDKSSLPALVPDDAIAWFDSQSKGVLFPNLTTAERDAIPTPRRGLVVYNTDSHHLQLFNGQGATGWQNL